MTEPFTASKPAVRFFFFGDRTGFLVSVEKLFACRQSIGVGVLAACFLACAVSRGGAEETKYSLYPHLEPETRFENYGIDRVNFDWGRIWERIWEENDNGIRASGSSINNPNLRWLVDTKIKQRLTPRVNFRYYYRQNMQYSYKDEEVGEFEIEYRVKDDYYASLVGRPFFNKLDADFGLIGKYHVDNRNYLHLGYIWVDAFTNFLYGRTEEEPTDHEYYLEQPAEYRLALAYTAGPWLVRAKAQVRPESAERLTFFAAGENDHIRRLAHDEGWLTLEYTPFVPSTVGIQVTADETKDGREYVLPADARTLQAVQKEHGVYLYYVHRLSGALELTVGGVYRYEDYDLDFPYNAAENYRYDRRNTNPVVFFRFDRRSWIYETGYLADDMYAERRYPNNAARNEVIRFEQQRLVLAAEYLFSPDARVRIVLGLDVDEWKAVVPYDHGGILFSIVWR